MSDLINLETAEGQVPDYMRMVSLAMYNSTAMQNVAISHVEDVLQGKVKLTDTTNPFVTLMGVSSEGVSAMMLGWVSNLRKRYRVLSTNMTDLYPHLSDADYLGLFAVPHKQKVTLFMSVDALRARLIPQGDGSGIVTVPRYTTMRVDGVTFTLMYPITIRERAYGGWTAHYDLSSINEIQPLSSSSLYPIVVDHKDGSHFRLEFEMVQVMTESTQFDINPSVGVKRSVETSDKYCYARVWYMGRNTSNWVEMHTTHDEMVYDASKPTAVLTVTESSVLVRVPQVYLSTGLVTGKVRVDIYTTKGEIFLNTTGMSLTNFVSEFRGSTNDTLTSSDSAFLSIPNKFILFNGVSSGGRSGLSFEQVRERAIYNTLGANNIPITPNQLVQSLEDGGFTIRRFVDNITTRDLLASRPLPASQDTDLITPGSATMESVLTSIGELRQSKWVADNGARVTITPTALWRIENGVVVLCSDAEVTDLVAMEPDAMALAINSSKYLSSPFYYVVDTSSERLALRAYHLESPQALVTKYLGDNEPTGMTVEVGSVTMQNTGNGWHLIVTTASNQAWKDQDDVYKIAQLSFFPVGVGAAAALNADYLGTDDTGEDVFSFALTSGYDVDDANRVNMLGFHALNNEPREVFAELKQNFRLSFVTGSQLVNASTPTQLDGELVTIDLPNRTRVITSQQLEVEFGKHLKNLWTACRTLAPVTPWKTYDSDEPALWPENQYEINPENGTEIWYHADGTAYTKIIANKGDVMVINGEIQYSHRKGQVIYQGADPVPVDQSTLQRQLSMLFLEGCYYFATDASTTTYNAEMSSVLVDYITTGLDGFQEKTSERTRVFFYPKVTLGSVTAIVDGNTTAQIQADQQLVVRLGVAPRTFENAKLRSELERKSISVIYDFFSREVVSISDLLDALRVVYGSDVISVSVSGLGGSNNASAITMLNANERLSIKKKVTILESGEFTVRESVAVDFFNHSA